MVDAGTAFAQTHIQLMRNLTGFRKIGSLAGGLLVAAAWAAVCASATAQTNPAPRSFAPASLTQTNNPPAPRRPSIVFILADDLGYGDLGCYGQSKIKTPNIDKLATDGMRFTSFYAGSTVCAPSRAALMLGQHTGHLRIRGNAAGASLQPDEVTLAEVLKQGGYRTGLIGKWGLAAANLPGVPQKKGFDEFAGYLDNQHAHDYYTDHLWRYDPVTGFDGQEPLLENQGGQKGIYIPDMCTKAALNFIRRHKPDQFNRYRPFFLFLCYTTPHANNEEGRRTGNGMEVPSDAPYSLEPWPQVERNKAAMITRMDADIGKLLDLLKEMKIVDDTIVCFTSDNGPHKEGGVDPQFFQSSGPFRGIKRDLTEGGIRVPLIVRWPDKIKPGTVSDQVWAFWDVLPTFAEIARLRPPEKIDGISFLPTLLGKPQTNHHDFLYWEFHERGFHQAVRWGEWKGIRHGIEGKLELYDLKSDPGEKADVAEKHPDMVAKVEECLKTARTESPQWPVRKPVEAKKP